MQNDFTNVQKQNIKLSAWLFYALHANMPKQPNFIKIEKDAILLFNKWADGVRLSPLHRNIFRLAVFGKIADLKAGFLLGDMLPTLPKTDAQICFINSFGNDKIN